MMEIPGAKPPERYELGRLRDRLSFLYVEHSIVHRDGNAVTFADDEGTTHVPAAVLGAVLLGPGTRISHAAVSLLGMCGVTIVWVGEQGVRYWAHGRPISASSRMAEAQANLISNRRSRLAVAREMYRMRFGDDEDVSTATMAQLRGREGARMRRRYREESSRTGVAWRRRNYDADDFAAGDPINQALTAANAALYGVCHAAVVALGCVPSLGFVHKGTDRSFVFDVADLYKSEIALPVAFDVVASGSDNVPSDTRRAMRDRFVTSRLLQRIPDDIERLLDTTFDEEASLEADLLLWSESGDVDAGRNYGAETE